MRYTNRRNGYHGGISPQELVVPILLFSPEELLPDGYREIMRARPVWWNLDVPVGPTETRPMPAKGTGLPLFDASAVRPVVAQPLREPWWLGRLMDSEMLQAQRQRVVRAAVPDDRLKALLSTICSRGGRITVAAVAERLSIPFGRVSSTVAAAAQLLNFDGYQVLFTEGDEVVLNEAMLVTQFDLEV